MTQSHMTGNYYTVPAEQGINVSNNRATELLARASENIITLLKAELSELKQANRERSFNAANMINFILHNQRGEAIKSLDELNQQAINIKFNYDKKPLIDNPNQYSQTAQKKLLDALTIHLSAIAAGFQAGSFDYSQQTRPERQRVIERVYYVGGYRRYDYYHDDFWRDMFFIHMLSDWSWHSRGYHCHGPSMPYSRPTHRSSDSCDEDTLKGVVIAVVVLSVLVLAAASTYYLYFELGKTFDQLIHTENLISNSLKLSSLGGGAAGGVFLGLLLAAGLGASGPFLPIVLGICLALTAGAISTGFSGLVLNSINEKINSSSAISKDSRFKLSVFEKARLQRQGFDVTEVNEAIRELANCYAKTKNKTFGFNEDRTKLIRQLRELKSGKIKSDYFHFNHKAFHIKKVPTNELPPSYEETFPTAPPKQDTRPLAYNPNWSLFTPEPPSYEQACQSYQGPPPSAPPMEMVK